MGITITKQDAVSNTTPNESISVEKKKEVSFWSSEWNAGNFVREKIGFESLADWLEDKDKVCTDGKDDGELKPLEYLESFGKGFAGIVKGTLNHPIVTAATIGIGALLIKLTNKAILPAMIAGGAVLGAGITAYGMYNAAQSNKDGDTKRAFETMGNGLFTFLAATFGAKASLQEASKAGVTSAQNSNNMSNWEALIQNFKAVPEALKVSGTNIKSNTIGALNFNSKTPNTQTKNKTNNIQNEAKPEVTDAFLAEKYKATLKEIPDEYKADALAILRKEEAYSAALRKADPLEGIASGRSAGALNFRRELQGGTEAIVKEAILEKMGVKKIYWSNDYNGADPLVGYMYNGKQYGLDKSVTALDNNGILDVILKQVSSKNFPPEKVFDSGSLYVK